MKLRSKWEFGEASECRRGLPCGMGVFPEEQSRPLIGVVNGWNACDPGHVHLKARRVDARVSADALAERAKSYFWTFDESAYPRFLRLFAKNVGSMAHGGIWE